MAQFEEPLVKSKPLTLGNWGGLPVIALGPKGGKIIGYKSGGRPIYAGSSEAKKLVSRKQVTQDNIKDWLVGLGIPVKITPKGIVVPESSGKLLEHHFKVKPSFMYSGGWVFHGSQLGKALGKPLVPKTEAQKAVFQAKAASGELDKDPFPPLDELSHVKTLKSGQHSVELYQDKSGKKWTFKHSDVVISRAEEAAVRISRLLLGAERAAAAKHVTLNGKPGVLLEWIEGEVFNDYNHNDPPSKVLQKNPSEIMRHQIVDWVVSNHDSHAGNFLVTKSGKIGGYDKGQAWKFLGQDKLDTQFKPNASKQIYLPFWKRIHNGDIKLTDQDRKDMLAAAEETLDRLGTFSEDQFKSIVGMYADERAKHGANKDKLLQKMWSRVQNTRSDFESFLSQQFGYTVNLKSKSEDNFETMPESEPAKKDVATELTPASLTKFLIQNPGYDISAAELKYAWKVSSSKASAFLLGMYKDGQLDRKKTKVGWVYFLPKVETKALEEPDKPEVIEGGAKQPVVEEQVAGWPITKGKDTVFHPGNPPEPNVNWPSGYPGPGYKIQKNYKGEDFTIEFDLVDGKPVFTVFFPNGQKIDYQSPNAASDSMVLWNKKLPLDASASDKKHKYKVSYPAFRGLGIKKFVKELAASKTAPVEAIMGASGYSDEEIQKEIPAEEVVTPKALDPGFISDFKDMSVIPGSVFAYSTVGGAKAHAVSQPDGSWKAYWKNTLLAVKPTYQEFLDELKQDIVTYDLDSFYLYLPSEVPAGVKQGSLPQSIQKISGEAVWAAVEAEELVEPEKPAEVVPEEKPFGAPNYIEATKGLNIENDMDGKDLAPYVGNQPIGTKYTFERGWGEKVIVVVEKIGEDKWAFTNSEGQTTEQNDEKVKWYLNKEQTKAQLHPYLEKKPVDPKINNYEAGIAGLILVGGVNGTHLAPFIADQPIGTKYTYKTKLGVEFVTEKTSEDNWDTFSEYDIKFKLSNADLSKFINESHNVNIHTIAEKPVEAIVKEPPSYSPIEVGKVVTVKKQFADGKVAVSLEVLDDGKFKVFYPELPESFKLFDSLSAASDYVWVHQKGYTSVEDYKEKTGKKKIASGGGWKFWGVKPDVIEKAPKAPEVKPEVVDPKPTGIWPEKNLPLGQGDWSPMIKNAPIGAVIDLVSLGPTKAPSTYYKKTGTNKWVNKAGNELDNLDVVDKLKDTFTYNNWMPTAIGKEEKSEVTEPEVVEPEGKWIPLMPGAVSEKAVESYPVGIKIKVALNSGDAYTFEKEGPNSWATDIQNNFDLKKNIPNKIVALKLEVQSKEGSSLSVQFPEMGEPEEDVISPVPVALPIPKPKPPKKKKKKFTVYGNAKIYADPLDISNKNVSITIDGGFKLGEEQGWFSPEKEGLTPYGAKSPLWPGWVPPAGLVFEGEHEGKKYYLTTNTTGFSFIDNDPLKSAGFAIVDPEGNVGSAESLTAADSLKDAAKDLGGLPTDLKSLHQMFKLTNAHFLPGETKYTVAEGKGPYPVESLDTAPENMSDVQKEETVKGTWPIQEVIKGKYPKLGFQPNSTDSDKITISTKDNSEEGIEQINELLSHSGLAGKKVIFQGHAGSSVTLTMSEFQKEMTTTMSAFAAASLSPTVSAANWDTMPEGYPKTIEAGSTNESGYLDLMQKAPIGTQIYTPTLNVIIKKSGEDEWSTLGDDNEPVSETPNADMAVWLSSSSTYKSFSVIPPGSNASDLPEFIPEKTEPPPPPEAVKTESAKIKKAKEIAAWAKTHPSVSNPEHTHLLSYLVARLDLTDKLHARMEGDRILLGPDESFDDSGLSDIKGISGAYVPVETPMGKWLSFDVQKLKAALPEAGMMEGPDGEKYPAGTTFKSETVTTSKEDLIATEISKYSKHKTDDSKKTLKIQGNGEEQVAALQKVLDKYEIQGAEDIIPGSNYTLVGVPKTELKKIGKTETIVTPVVPAQPDLFIAKSLPLSGETQRDGQVATINRGDLGILEATKLQRSGNWIRCGKWGIFKGNQVAVRRVRDSEGNYFYEVRGHLFHTSVQTKKHQLKSGNLAIPKTDGTKYEGYNYKQQTYDAEEGCSVETGFGDAYSFPGLSGATEKGSTIELVDKGKPSINGTFRIRISEGEDVETELGNAFQKMGLDPVKALAEPTEEDNRMYLKHEVLKAQSGAAGHFLARGIVTNEKKLDQEIKNKNLGSMVGNASMETAFNGKQCVIVDDMEKAKNKGVGFVYMGVPTWRDIAIRLFENSGMWSNKTKILSGLVGSAASLSQDIASGGVNAAFARFGNVEVKTADWGFKCSNAKFIFKRDVLKRADWYAWTGDSYGALNTSNTHSGNVSKKREDSYNNTGSSNEVNFEDGLSFQHLAGVTVNDAYTRKEIIEWLNDKGMTEFNGIPLEDFVVNTDGTTDRGLVASKVKGLHEKD